MEIYDKIVWLPSTIGPEGKNNNKKIIWKISGSVDGGVATEYIIIEYLCIQKEDSRTDAYNTGIAGKSKAPRRWGVSFWNKLQKGTLYRIDPENDAVTVKTAY